MYIYIYIIFESVTVCGDIPKMLSNRIDKSMRVFAFVEGILQATHACKILRMQQNESRLVMSALEKPMLFDNHLAPSDLTYL